MGCKKTMNRLLLAFIISTFLFIIAISFGSFLSVLKVYDIDEMQYDLITDVNANNLGYLLLLEDPCDVEIGNEINEEISDLGRKLSFMETQRGRGNEEVKRLREYYSLLQIKHYLFMKSIKEECGRDYDLVLYFYEECDLCQDQGFLLKYFKDKYGDIYVYAFDYHSDNEAIQSLKKKYDVGIFGVVVNDIVYNEIMSKEEFKDIFDV